MRIVRWIFGGSAALALTALTVEGCGSSKSGYPDNVCGAPTPCSNPVPPTEAQVQQCTTLLNNPTCGTAYGAMRECQTYRPTCSASGSFDSRATAAACAPEITAYGQCASGQDGGLDGCRPRTCAQAGANCGQISDGCGGQVACGTCTNGEACGANTPNRCGCGCDPTWCGRITACGTSVACPATCATPQTCGGGGQANRCGCLPAGSAMAISTSVTTAAISTDGGTQAFWSNATAAASSDNNYASASMAPSTTTQYLLALSFGFVLPVNATIDGIDVAIERSATSGLATSDYALNLVKNASIQALASNKAAVGVVWPAADAIATYGGATDKWGNTWTASDINSAGFGVALSARYTGLSGSELARVDAIGVTIHYSGVVCN